MVKAKELGTVKIVSYDCLAESLLQASRTPKHVKDYLWVNILKGDKKSQVGKASTENEKDGTATDEGGGQAEGDEAEAVRSYDPFDSKRRTAKAESITSNHRLYEAENVTFSTTLVHQSLVARNHKASVLLRVDSSTKCFKSPLRNTHQVHAPGPSKTEFSAPLERDLDTAMATFRDFFKGQTGKQWENRLGGVSPPPKTDKNGNSLPVQKGWFWYDNRGPDCFVFGTFVSRW
ncbi:hypothetical protein BDV06DRAFT_221123 [Aspergillus oleicola]